MFLDKDSECMAQAIFSPTDAGTQNLSIEGQIGNIGLAYIYLTWLAILASGTIVALVLGQLVVASQFTTL